MLKLKYVLLLLTGLVACRAAFSQTSQNFVQLVEDAEKETIAKNWSQAILLWEKVNEQNPVHYNYTYQLGNAYEQSEQYEKAVRYYQMNYELNSSRSYYSAFNLAKAYAKWGDKDNAMNWIKKSFDLGMPERNVFKHPAFDILKSLPDYQYIASIQDVSQLNRTEGWRYDLAFLKDEISRKAFNVVRNFTKEDLEKETERIHNAIPGLTDIQVTVEFMKLLVKVGDGHTQFYARTETAELRKHIPVEFYWFREGLYIVQADKRFENLLGAKVISMEGKTPEDIFIALTPLLSKDNAQTTKIMSTMRMRQTAILHAMGLSKSPDNLSLALMDKNGKNIYVVLPADSEITSRRLWDGLPANWAGLENTIAQKPPYLRDRYSYYWFEYLEKEKTVWFQYNKVLNDVTKPYPKFLDSLFSFIEKNNVERLVIDLRNNNGGNGELSYPLIEKITGTKKINQKGKLFVITGRKTFSAAGICISLLEKHTRAIFAGEPAGTSPLFIGEEFEFTLPYSHLTGNVSDREHHYANAVDFRVWIAPTLYAEPSYEDFIKGKDPVWEGILASYPFKKAE